MKITTKCALEVLSHEAIVRQAYKDSVGVWTWSVGITNGSGHDVERYIDNPAPMSDCLDVFFWALESYSDAVISAFHPIELTEEQHAAALSFHYNTGAIARATWVKSFKNGNVDSARDEIMNWRSPSEIIPRREKERDLFFDGVWSNDGTATEYTRVTSSYSPDWASAICVDISKDIEALLNPKAEKTSLFSFILGLLTGVKK